jgi:phage-related minor tail protein
LVYGLKKKTNHNSEKEKSRLVDRLQKESTSAKEETTNVEERPGSNLENKLKVYQDELNKPVSRVETDW